LAGATGGRFELGIGAGWLAEDHTVLGGPWRSAEERVSRLEEALVLIRACWAGEPVTFAGEHSPSTGWPTAPRRRTRRGSSSAGVGHGCSESRPGMPTSWGSRRTCGAAGSARPRPGRPPWTW
jgi:hypothetical protein